MMRSKVTQCKAYCMSHRHEYVDLCIMKAILTVSVEREVNFHQYPNNMKILYSFRQKIRFTNILQHPGFITNVICSLDCDNTA